MTGGHASGNASGLRRARRTRRRIARRSAAALRPRRATSASPCTTISPRSSRTGARSSRSPTAPCSRASTGSSTWQHHIGSANGVAPAIVTGRDGQGRLLFLLPLAHRARRLRAPADLARHRCCATTTARCSRRTSASASTRRASSSFGARSRRGCKAIRGCRFDVVSFRQDAGRGRRAAQSVHRARRHAACQRRLSDAALSGDWESVLQRQAVVGDAPARPHQAQEARRVRRGPVRQPRRGRASSRPRSKR